MEERDFRENVTRQHIREKRWECWFWQESNWWSFSRFKLPWLLRYLRKQRCCLLSWLAVLWVECFVTSVQVKVLAIHQGKWRRQFLAHGVWLRMWAGKWTCWLGNVTLFEYYYFFYKKLLSGNCGAAAREVATWTLTPTLKSKAES